MYVRINPENGLALYLQVVKQVKYLVACGALRAGDRLPPVRELAVQLRINPNTVAKAYRELRYEKVINSKWGDGNFVSKEVDKIAESEKKKIVAEVLDQAVHQGVNLGLSKDELTKLFSERLKGLKTKGAKR